MLDHSLISRGTEICRHLLHRASQYARAPVTDSRRAAYPFQRDISCHREFSTSIDRFDRYSQSRARAARRDQYHNTRTTPLHRRSMATTQPQTHWATKNGTLPPSTYDLRSDTLTIPTKSMLDAIAACTLHDDVYMEDPTTTDLESWIAELTGKEAALLVMSGTMGNQVALKTHLAQPPYAVLCDYRAHVLCWEAGGAATLSGALMQGVKPKNEIYLTVEDIREAAVLDDDVHSCPTKVISLENTLGGTVMPLDEARKIAAFAKENGLIMHLDGARLWEAVAAGRGTLKEYCECFDSIQLCFSKGLGAPIGSILVGTKPFIKRSRHLRKMLGGGIRQAGVISAAARVSVEETFLGGLLTQSHENARTVARNWQDKGGKLQWPVETNMVWLDLKAHGISVADFIKVAQANGIRVNGGRLVIHYQAVQDTIDRLDRAFEELMSGKRGEDVSKNEAPIPPEDMRLNVE